MSIYTAIIATLFVGASLVHLVIACFFRTRMALHVPEPTANEDRGLASIMLSIRGCDPGLKNTLIQLLNQDYENYEVHLIVDHKSDAAWNLVHQIKSEFDVASRFRIHEMRKPNKTCGLKCSSLLQGLNNVSHHSSYLVLIDADVTPHSSWLGQLIAPLADKKIGVVTGNQWYEPETPTAGSVLRSLWNAGALVPTAILSNPWAGTFAMRMEDVRRAKLQKIWRKSIVDDGPIRQALRPLGLSIYFSPSLIMVNRDRCTFKYVNRYVSRMLTWSRMYETTFINTVLHAIITFGLLAASLGIFLLSMFNQNWNSAMVVGSGLLAGLVLTSISYFVVRNAVSHCIGMRGETLQRLSIARVFRYILLTPMAQFIYCVSCFRASLTQQVQWRQITYELKGKSKVEMVRYRPWIAAEPEQVRSEVSI